MSIQQVIDKQLRWHIECGDTIDVMRSMPDNSVNCVVTSPPYWNLRDYEIAGQIGMEPTLYEFITKMVEVFTEVRRVLTKDGTCWVNLGDCYAGSGKGGQSESKRSKEWQPTYPKNTIKELKPKNICGVPWRVAFALQESGWWLRQDIVWWKNNPMPLPVKDRFTTAKEYIFLLTKSARYNWNFDDIQEPCVTKENRPSCLERNRTKGYKSKENAIRNRKQDYTGNPTYTGFIDRYEPRDTRNPRDVWQINTQPCKEAHFATYPEEIPYRCIAAGCPVDGIVLDPFSGAGTTLLVAQKMGMYGIGIELNPEYITIAKNRINQKEMSLFTLKEKNGRGL